ncbi:MAG: hypothetical protein OXG91_01135 [bacterium]|nr:hypothetical protein [bacterium]MCY3953792.1 hypothetical protein [bacterium]
METGSLELIITAVSITGTILAAVFAAFGFLHRELRRLDAKVDEKFERVDEKFERIDEKFNKKFDGLRAVLTSVQVSVARIEGHLGIGFPPDDEQRQPSERPDCAA